MHSIDLQELKLWDASGKDFLLLDVRETFEHEQFNIGGLNIPLGTIIQELHRIPADKDIVVYCAKGIRSIIALQKLETKGYKQVYNLSGGITALQ